MTGFYPATYRKSLFGVAMIIANINVIQPRRTSCSFSLSEEVSRGLQRLNTRTHQRSATRHPDFSMAQAVPPRCISIIMAIALIDKALALVTYYFCESADSYNYLFSRFKIYSLPQSYNLLHWHSYQIIRFHSIIPYKGALGVVLMFYIY